MRVEVWVEVGVEVGVEVQVGARIRVDSSCEVEELGPQCKAGDS